MLTSLYVTAQTAILAAPVTPSPTAPANPNPSINTTPVLEAIGQWIAPILIAIVGVWVVSRATQGQMSRVMTSTAIVMVGVALIGGAGVLVFIGDDLVRLIVQ